MADISRLLRLADHLDSVSPNHFSLEAWQCRTKACAVGHACDIPEFFAAGLRLVGNLDGRAPHFKDEYEWEAVCQFFDICFDDATRLFLDDEYPDDAGPVDVASRIRLYCAERMALTTQPEPQLSTSSSYHQAAS